MNQEPLRKKVTELLKSAINPRAENLCPICNYAISCQGTIPEAIIAFLKSTSFEDAIRNAVSLGGDADTLARITGSIAHPLLRQFIRKHNRKGKRAPDLRPSGYNPGFLTPDTG